MSSGGGGGGKAPSSSAVSAAQQKADKEAAKAAKKMRNEVGAEGSSILTSGAGILDDTELQRNLLGANAYRIGNTRLG